MSVHAPERPVEHGTDDRTRVAVRRWDGDDSRHPPVVLVPGLALSARYLVPTATRLAGRFRVIAADPPGFGWSQGRHWPPTPHALAAALALLVEAEDVAPVSLVANSFGCQVATAVASTHPELVDRLVLSSPTLDPELRGPARAAAALAREQTTQSWSMRAIVARDELLAGPRRVIATARAALDDPVEERFPAVRHPTLVVRGDNDPFVSAAWARAVVRLLPDGELHELPDAVHAMPHENAEAFVEEIASFLEEATP
jgi:2-hydroxy-6-oxonona-2,4-dienedioate hydrolase